MHQARLNHLSLLHVHNEKVDALNLIDVANQFVQGSEHRKFTYMDIWTEWVFV